MLSKPSLAVARICIIFEKHIAEQNRELCIKSTLKCCIALKHLLAQTTEGGVFYFQSVMWFRFCCLCDCDYCSLHCNSKTSLNNAYYR